MPTCFQGVAEVSRSKSVMWNADGSPVVAEINDHYTIGKDGRIILVKLSSAQLVQCAT